MQRLLALTREQRASLVRLRSICLSTLGAIIEERNCIHAFLTVRGGAPATPLQHASRTLVQKEMPVIFGALGLSELMHANGPGYFHSRALSCRSWRLSDRRAGSDACGCGRSACCSSIPEGAAALLLSMPV